MLTADIRSLAAVRDAIKGFLKQYIPNKAWYVTTETNNELALFTLLYYTESSLRTTNLKWHLQIEDNPKLKRLYCVNVATHFKPRDLRHIIYGNTSVGAGGTMGLIDVYARDSYRVLRYDYSKFVSKLEKYLVDEDPRGPEHGESLDLAYSVLEPVFRLLKPESRAQVQEPQVQEEEEVVAICSVDCEDLLRNMTLCDLFLSSESYFKAQRQVSGAIVRYTVRGTDVTRILAKQLINELDYKLVVRYTKGGNICMFQKI